MPQPTLPADPAAPVKPRTPITPGQQAKRTGGIIGQTGGLMGILYYLGVDGELAVILGGAYGFIISVLARWARDKYGDGQDKSLWLYLLSALAPVFLLIVTGCATQFKLGPGPYGWVQLNYSIADTANLHVSALGSEFQLGDPSKRQASSPGGEGQE